MKTCTKCNEEKYESDFYGTGRAGKYKSICKECDRKIQWRRKSNNIREARQKEKIQMSKKHLPRCKCCLGYVEKSAMDDKKFCKWCVEHIENYDKR